MSFFDRNGPDIHTHPLKVRVKKNLDQPPPEGHVGEYVILDSKHIKLKGDNQHCMP